MSVRGTALPRRPETAREGLSVCCCELQGYTLACPITGAPAVVDTLQQVAQLPGAGKNLGDLRQ